MERLNIVMLLRRHGIRPRRSWSQNFLVDPAVMEAIVIAARVDDRPTIELGAGLGVLTARLALRAARVIAVERDRRLAAVLRAEFAGNPVVQVEEANAARLDYSAWRHRLGERPVVVGNLPYHMAAPILFTLLGQVVELRRFVLMFQKEMAERILAGAGDRRSGVLGLLVQNSVKVEQVIEVPPQAFYPVPRVRSSVLLFEPRDQPLVASELLPWFERVVKAAFAQRRKQVKNALRVLVGREEGNLLKRRLEAAGIDGSARAENLTFEQFIELARQLRDASQAHPPTE